MRKYATTEDNNIQKWGNMPQQWILIYRNEEICYNSSNDFWLPLEKFGQLGINDKDWFSKQPPWPFSFLKSPKGCSLMCKEHGTLQIHTHYFTQTGYYNMTPPHNRETNSATPTANWVDRLKSSLISGE
jgi:hypothetical protein